MPRKYTVIPNLGRQRSEYAQLRAMREHLFAEADAAYRNLSGRVPEAQALRIRNELYRSAEIIFRDILPSLCPDVYRRPIYELEIFPANVIHALTSMEESNKYGRKVTVDSLSRLAHDQITALTRIGGVGRKSLDRISEALQGYGVKWDI